MSQDANVFSDCQSKSQTALLWYVKFWTQFWPTAFQTFTSWWETLRYCYYFFFDFYFNKWLNKFLIYDYRVSSTGCQEFPFVAPFQCQNLSVVLLLSIKVGSTGCPKGNPPVFGSCGKLRSFTLSIIKGRPFYYYKASRHNKNIKHYVPC